MDDQNQLPSWVTATNAITVQLAETNAPADPSVRAAAVYLALAAWRDLGAGGGWDHFGLDMLEVRDRHYLAHGVEVEVAAAQADSATLSAVRRMVEQLACVHDRLASEDQLPVATRLDHEASAHQLRRAVAALP